MEIRKRPNQDVCIGFSRTIARSPRSPLLFPTYLAGPFSRAPRTRLFASSFLTSRVVDRMGLPEWSCICDVSVNVQALIVLTSRFLTICVHLFVPGVTYC
jgi:hypothetical protein